MKRAFFAASAILCALFAGHCYAADTVEAPDADGAILVEGNNTFAVDLYAKLIEKEKGNVFFSPVSISSAFGMAYAGARGNTAAEIEKVMHFVLGQERLHDAIGSLAGRLDAEKEKSGYQLSIANALWGDVKLEYVPEFLKVTTGKYRAEANRLDFAKTEDARRTINAWVEKKTQDRIKDLIPQGVLSRDTRLVLANAIYFKGDWAVPFKQAMTSGADFTLLSGKKVKAQMMNMTGGFRYAESEQGQALEMKYAGGKLAMLILLPGKPSGLPEFEKDRLAAELLGDFSKMRERQVNVWLPRFKMTLAADLKALLISMGMVDAFSEQADFSGMAKEPVYISDALHKAFVEVNEQGTEAAAATALVMKAASIAAPPPVFRADHPFIFVIRDVESGAILFMGRVADPTAG